MQTPHATPAGTPDAHGAAHAGEHHGSWAPLIVALFGAPFLALGILFPMTALPVGLVGMTIGLGWWFREDVKRFRKLVKGQVHDADHDIGKLDRGIWSMLLFLGSEVIVFGSLFAIWFVGKSQLGAGFQPEGVHLPVPTALINTALLVASGGVLHWGMQRLKKENRKPFLVAMFLSIVLGLVFLVLQIREYVVLVGEGFTLKSGLFGSSFYSLTGTHGLHVAGGLLFLIIVFWRSLIGSQTAKHHIALETAAMYWHFVDAVWIVLVAIVYLQWI